MENLFQQIETEVKKILGNDFCPDIVENINCALCSYRYLRYELFTYPDKVIKDLFDNKITELVYIPCDIVELRPTLNNMNVCEKLKCLFSLDFAKKYFLDYPIWLGFSYTDGQEVGNLLLNVNEAKITRIYINYAILKNDPNKVSVIRKIIDEERNKNPDLKVDVNLLNELHVLSNPKIASTMTKYRINIPSLGINDVVNSETPEEAVKQIVLKKRKMVEEQTKSEIDFDGNLISKKYNPDFWAKNILKYPDMVKKAQVKESWEMTQLEFYESRKFGKFPLDPFDAKFIHMDDVKDAILAGKPVSAKVVEDYKGRPWADKYIAKMNINKTAQVQLCQFTLNEKEQQIFNLIKEAIVASGKDISARLVGGAVRDKLLCQDNDDIDIAVGGVSGLDFAKYLGQYAKTRNIPDVSEPYEVSLEKTGSDKSKKQEASETLKVGGISIFGQKVEFVSLRTEEYSEVSRKPVVKATNDVKEDVIRRDLTINALYYNILTGQIEDYIGGVEDLKNMVLKTPSDPNKTFEDDPLRMLRVLRFHSRYPNSKLDPSIVKIMNDSQDPNSAFSKNYMAKVDPSRASKELRKLFAGQNPISSTRLMLESGFYKLLFRVPEAWHPIKMDQSSPYHNMNLMEHVIGVLKNINDLSKMKEFSVSPDEKSLLFISALLHDFGKMHPDIRKVKTDKEGKPVMFDRAGQQLPQYRYIGHEVESAKFAENILKQMNFGPDDRKFVTTVIAEHMYPHDMYRITNEHKMKKFIGSMLHRVGPLYNKIIYHAMADSLSKENLPEEEANIIRSRYLKNLKDIQDYEKEMGELVNKPLLNGDEIKNILGAEIERRNLGPKDIMQQQIFIDTPAGKKHFLAAIQHDLLSRQHSGEIKTKENAEKFIIGNYIKPIVNELNNMKKNINKQADIGDHNKKNIFNLLDRFDYNKNQDEMQRVEKQVVIPFQKGDKVRLRINNGPNMYIPPYIEGRVKFVGDALIVVRWEEGKYLGKSMKGKISRFQTHNPLELALMIEKI